MRATRPHIPVMSYEAKKGAELFHCFRRLHGEHSFGLWVWLESIRCEPISKEVYFFDGPFKFPRIDDKSFSAKASENCANEDQVSFEFVAEACDIIDVDFEVVYTVEYLFHNFLSNVRRLGNFHWKAIVAI